MPVKFAQMLHCIKCSGDLAEESGNFFCVSCGASYPIINEVVYFTESEAGHPTEGIPDSIMVKVKNLFKRNNRLYYILTYIFGVSDAGISPKIFLLTHVKPGQAAVNLGAGSQRKYPDVLHVDYFAFPDVDIVADLNQLPFKNQSVDAVVCTSVLEHVADQKKVLDEICRVLKPGGACYLTTPFMYPYHSSPHDYARWTLPGLEDLASRSGLVVEDAGLRHGPTSALILMFVNWLAILFSFGNSMVFDALTILGMVVLAPLGHIFDFGLNRLKVSRNAASGYYYIGVKK